MPSQSDNQLTLNFEPTLPEKYRSLRDFMAYRVQVQAKPAKTIAADMDMSPSTLSRKLNPAEGDTQRFNLDDLEQYIQSTKDVASVIEYLAAKYMDSPDARKARVLTRVESMLPELMAMVSSLRESA
jgi:AraC-like DNA-binding protein